MAPAIALLMIVFPSWAASQSLAPDASRAPSPSPAQVSAASAASSGWAVSVMPPMLRLGIDRSAQIQIRASEPRQAIPEVRASVGTVRDVTRTGPATFVARYEPPASRAPDIAILAVLGSNDLPPGIATIQLAGRYHLTLDVERGAEVTVQLADGSERRAVAPPHGPLDVMLHVPPGIDRARILATDPTGNSTERVEMLELPPLHRVLLLRADHDRVSAGSLRWFILASDSTGALQNELRDTVELNGVPAAVAVRAPGVFEVDAAIRRGIEPTTIALRIVAERASPVPDSDEVVVPAVVPSRVVLSTPDRVRAGEPMTIRVAVESTEGPRISTSAGALTVRLDGAELAPPEGGDAFVLPIAAPDRVGTHEVVATFSAPGRAPMSASNSFRVDAGPAVRLVARPVALRVGTSSQIQFTALDRFGNPAVAQHCTVTGTGAAIQHVQPQPNGLAVTLEPTDRAVRVSIRGDFDLRDAVAFDAAPAPHRPFTLSLLATVRSNLGAAGFFGGRLEAGGQISLGRHFEGLALADLGVDGTYAQNAQGANVSVFAIPFGVRLGVARRVGDWQLGLVGGLIARGVVAWAVSSDGGRITSTAMVPGAAGSIVVRWFVPAGVLTLDLGVESGALDTPAAHGTLGGVQAAVGWGAAW